MKPIRDLVARLPKFEPCGNCSEDGFVVDVGGRYQMDARKDGWYLRRCPCWLAHQEKIARELSAVSDTGKKRKS
jgi:hypothetical protein